MKPIIEFIDTILMSFRGAFSRRSTFEWFVVAVIGMILKSDQIGVTSIIRELCINPNHYENLLHMFRSEAWKREIFINKWIECATTHSTPICIDGYNILIGDGVKQSKEGKKMPGVKKLHQESQNSAKAKYIFGHLFGVVSILIGDTRKQFALPLVATIQEGVNIIHKYNNPDISVPSHALQIIEQAGIVVKKLGKSIIILDRYFLSSSAIRKALEFENKQMEQSLEMVVKSKISCRAYKEPPAYGGKGRPRLKGDPVKLKELFKTEQDKFITAELYLYGKLQTIKYYSIDLLWGTKLYKKLRFVLVKTESFAPTILVSTSLSLSPTQIIELYSYRYKIEMNFKTLKHTIAGFAYHFWSFYMPKLNRYNKEHNITALEMITETHAQKRIISSLYAIENYVMCACVSCGILQLISLKFSDVGKFYNFRWLRTVTKSVVSEDTVAYFIRKNFFRDINKCCNFGIMRIILSKQKCNSKKSCNSA